MNVVDPSRERDSLGYRIASLSADRIEIPVESYHGASPQGRRPFGGSSALCFLILWIALLAVGRERMLRDPGTLWHTVVGEQMLESRQWITTDSFSFTFEGKPWIAQQWLAECAMAMVHRAAGLDGLLLGAVTILAATFAWIFGRLRRAGMPVPIAVVALALMIAASSYHFHPRPHLATMAMAAWTFGLLCDVETGRRSWKWLYALPPVMALWTNLHGGALAGVATTALVLFAWAGRSLWKRNKASADNRSIPVVHCMSAAIACSAAILVNPYGLALPKVWLALTSSAVLPKIISEHGPLSLVSVEGMAIVAVAVVYLIVLAGCWRNGSRLTWWLPLLWLPLAFMRVRHGPLFALTAAVAIAEMWPVSRTVQRLVGRSFVSTSASRHASRLGIAICAGVVLSAFGLESMEIRLPMIGAGWARLNPGYWPVEATQAACGYLKDHPSKGRIFNDMNFGGYLIAKLPQARVYIDDRCELYGDEFLQRYVEVLKEPARIEQEAAAHAIDLALVRSGSRMAYYMASSATWTTLHHDQVASLFARKSLSRTAATR